MKTKYRSIIANLLLLFIAFGCTKELDIEEDFDFSLRTNHKESGYVAELNRNTITIEPDKIVGGNKYFISYKILEGDGDYHLNNGTKLEEDTEYELESLSFELNYFPKTPNDHNTRITIRDINFNERTLELPYSILFPNLDFGGIPLKNTLYVDEQTEIRFNISQISTQNRDYSMSFEMIKGNVSVENSAGNNLNAGTLYPIPYGNFTWSIENKSIEPIELIFTVKNSAGNNETKKILINTNETSYNFTAFANTNSAEIEELVPINFSINQFGYEDLEYTLRFSSQKNIALLYQGKEYRLGEIIPVSKGSFIGYLKFSEVGTTNINFMLDSSVNKPKTWDISIDVSKYDEPFDYEIIIEPYKKIKGQSFDVIPVINTTSYRASTRYFIQCNLSNLDKDAYVMYDNKKYYDNDTFEIDYFNTTIKMTSNIDENHDVTFKIYNNSNLSNIITKTVNIDMLKTLEIESLNTAILLNNSNLPYIIGARWVFSSLDEDYKDSDISVKLEILNKNTNSFDKIGIITNGLLRKPLYHTFEKYQSRTKIVNDYNDQPYRATFTDPEGNKTLHTGIFTEEDYDKN